MCSHPIEQFNPPRAITTGQALKDLLDDHYVTLLADSLQPVAEFDRAAFIAAGRDGLLDLELKQRADHLASCMAMVLPTAPAKAFRLLCKALGPELVSADEFGLQPMFYLPHTQYLFHHGPKNIARALDANERLTKCFTSEFSIRSLLMHDRSACMDRLHAWCHNASPHVRRLVSEGTRPRLPWAPRLQEFDADPHLALPLLEQLKDDDVRYVTRSVANHLGDIGKAHLEVLLDTCARWLKESTALEADRARERRWLIRHALRHPAKKGNAAALRLRKRAA